MTKSKNTLLIVALISLTGIKTWAQHIGTAKVPAEVKAGFAKAFPGVSHVKWELENGDYEAGFKQNSKEMSAIITPKGILKEWEVTIPVAALPAVIPSYIKQHYKNSAIKEAAKITKAGGIINYEAEVNKKDLLFDEKGNFIGAVKD